MDFFLFLLVLDDFNNGVFGYVVLLLGLSLVWWFVVFDEFFDVLKVEWFDEEGIGVNGVFFYD